MAGRGYVGVNNTARTVKSAYVGVGGTARRIVKGYVGVGGVARPCFGGSGITYFGTAPERLNTALYDLGAASTPGYALFAGGRKRDNTISQSVEAFDELLTKVAAADLVGPRAMQMRGSFGEYAVFASGFYSESGAIGTQVAAYCDTLTRTDLPTLNIGGYLGGGEGAAVSNDDYFLVGGGCTGGFALDGNVAKTIQAYSKAFAKSQPEYMNVGRWGVTAARAGEYAIFAGGSSKTTEEGYENASVDVYSNALTHTALSSSTYLSQSRSLMGGAANDHFAVFAGGRRRSATCSRVDAYNGDLTRFLAAELPVGVERPAGINSGKYAMFFGGFSTPRYQNAVSTAVAYDTEMTQVLVDDLREARGSCAGAMAGRRALVGGGLSAAEIDNVEVYTIN